MHSDSRHLLWKKCQAVSVSHKVPLKKTLPLTSIFNLGKTRKAQPFKVNRSTGKRNHVTKLAGSGSSNPIHALAHTIHYNPPPDCKTAALISFKTKIPCHLHSPKWPTTFLSDPEGRLWQGADCIWQHRLEPSHWFKLPNHDNVSGLTAETRSTHFHSSHTHREIFVLATSPKKKHKQHSVRDLCEETVGTVWPKKKKNSRAVNLIIT